MKTFLDIKNDENELKGIKVDNKEYLDSLEYSLNYYEEILDKRILRKKNDIFLIKNLNALLIIIYYIKFKLKF